MFVAVTLMSQPRCMFRIGGDLVSSPSLDESSEVMTTLCNDSSHFPLLAGRRTTWDGTLAVPSRRSEDSRLQEIIQLRIVIVFTSDC